MDEENSQTAGVSVQITILFIAAGIRKEHSRDDIHRLAQRLVKFRLIEPDQTSGRETKP